mmetsp:Transcript_41907/g.121149  ORF Transcript_41907/g.121149 Transcript_41907/m.121149 type:complete len:85 (+) Transcript_41907:278-532(+)
MDKLATEYAGKATFICVNTRSVSDAQAYKQQKGLKSTALVHGAGQPPAEYGLRYIPHKVVIGSDGKVKKNFDGVNLSRDVKELV